MSVIEIKLDYAKGFKYQIWFLRIMGDSVQTRSLVIDSLVKRFGGNIAVDGVSMKILPGKINLLMGANGSGKSTLVNCISGFFPAEAGMIRYGQVKIYNLSPDKIFHKGIIRTFQTPRLFENLSVLENLMLASHNVGERFTRSMIPQRWLRDEKSNTRKAISILESLGLENLQDNLAYDLSGGQIKLLELGKVLMADSSIVILDEPIAGINPVLAHKIFERIRNMCDTQNITFLIIEHRLDIALKYADYCFVLSNGSLIAQDTPDKILDDQKVIDSYL